MFQGKTNNINCNYKVNEGKAALIRIEDVSAGGVFLKIIIWKNEIFK